MVVVVEIAPPTAAFYGFATMEMKRQAVDASAPVFGVVDENLLTEERLEVLLPAIAPKHYAEKLFSKP